MVKGAIRGTFSGLFSALCTSTVNVSNKFLNPKVIAAAVGVAEAMILIKKPDFLAKCLVNAVELAFFGLWDSDLIIVESIGCSVLQFSV